MASNALKNEYQGFLNKGLLKNLDQIYNLIQDCGQRYPLAIWGNEETTTCEKFVLCSDSPDYLECNLIIMGDNIHQAEINYKPSNFVVATASSSSNSIPFKLNIQPDSPWKLQQIQDSANYLYLASNYLENILVQKIDSLTLYQAQGIVDDLNVYLIRGRNCLTMPHRKTFDEILNSQTMKILEPNLPKDTAFSVYLNGNKLIVALYTISKTGDWDVVQADCQIEWIKDVLFNYSKVLETLGHLSDKVAMFSNATLDGTT